MSKKTATKTGTAKREARLYVAGKQTPNRWQRLLLAIAAWLTNRSRLVRTAIAGLLALGMAGSTAIFLYGILLTVTPDSFAFYAMTRFDILSVVLLVSIILGFIFYGIGWRFFIGFDLGETSHQPGRPAAIWVVVAIAIIGGTALISILAALIAVQP